MNKNSFLIDLSESARTDFGRVELASQSEPQKVFSSIWELESQVNNGGFEQYFRNAGADDVSYGPIALVKIGATKCAEIVEQAIALVGPRVSSPEETAAKFDGLGDEALQQLAALDQQFLAYPDNLTELLFDHVNRHPEEFGETSV